MDLENRKEKEIEAIQTGGKKLRDDMETDGVVDSYEKRQGAMPDVDETLIGAKIEQLWEFKEEDGTVVP